MTQALEIKRVFGRKEESGQRERVGPSCSFFPGESPLPCTPGRGVQLYRYIWECFMVRLRDNLYTGALQYTGTWY